MMWGSCTLVGLYPPASVVVRFRLSPDTASALFASGVATTSDVLRVDRTRVSELAGVRDHEKLLLRGALLQFRQSDYQDAKQQAARGEASPLCAPFGGLPGAGRPFPKREKQLYLCLL